MSKYDFELNLSLNTSTGLILSKIKKGSKVLEFGCAEGRMTRYMKEELDCSVYICEYNPEAFEKAKEYAADGICTDIMKYEWCDKFAGMSFDHILFADVLEHLADPRAVLKRAGEMLSPGGTIIASLPNVTHNDIILKATDEHFDYMDTGLLDDTHIHFWGKKNLKPFIEKTGLFLEKVEGTYFETGFSEQLYGQSLRPYSPYLQAILKERECGEVYQFVITCVRPEATATDRASNVGTSSGDAELNTKPGTVIENGKDGKDTVEIFRTPSVKSALYYDRGDGYSEGNRDYVFSERIERGKYRAEIRIEDTAGLRELRFDPVDNQPCIITKAVARQDGRELEIRYPRCVSAQCGRIIYGDDPQIMIPTEAGGAPVEIEAEFIIAGDRYIEALTEAVFCFSEEQNTKRN